MRMRKGQVSLEFMFVFAIIAVLLVYSVNNTTFKQGSASVDTLKVEIALEEKNLANAISNTIDQVYSQGPGSKATSYVHLVYLRNGDYLKKAWRVSDPKIFITYGPYDSIGNGTYITVLNGTGSTNIFLQGDNKNTFWSRSMYQAVLLDKLVWSPEGSVNVDSTTIYGLEVGPNDLPSSLRIVVEWNPDNPNNWTYDSSKGELRININPGG